MRKRELHFFQFCARLDRGEAQTFVRWGDGEFSAAMGLEGQNCDGSRYTTQLGFDLFNVLYMPRAHPYGVMRIAEKVFGAELERWLETHEIQEVDWVNGHLLLDRSWAGELFPFINALRQVERQKRPICYVGPAHLAGLRQVGIPWTHFIKIPEIDAHDQTPWIVDKLLELYNADELNVVLFSAGLATPVIVWKLFPYVGIKVSLVDIGSMFDVLVGVRSRSYARELDWKRLIPLNLTGKEP